MKESKTVYLVIDGNQPIRVFSSIVAVANAYGYTRQTIGNNIKRDGKYRDKEDRLILPATLEG
jgi:hypothetical protein